jgi:hypothetical protein
MTLRHFFKTQISLTLLVCLSLTMTNCGSEDTAEPEDIVDGSVAPFLKVDGTIFNEVYQQILQPDDKNDFTMVRYDNFNHTLTLRHERAISGNTDSLVQRSYIPSHEISNEAIGYGVSMSYRDITKGPDCEFSTRAEDLNGMNGTYKLKKVDGKYVSEFSNVSLYCEIDGTKHSVVVDGLVIWEEK